MKLEPKERNDSPPLLTNSVLTKFVMRDLLLYPPDRFWHDKDGNERKPPVYVIVGRSDSATENTTVPLEKGRPSPIEIRLYRSYVWVRSQQLPEREVYLLRKLLAYLKIQCGDDIGEVCESFGEDIDWGLRLLKDVEKRGLHALGVDGRSKNGKAPLYLTPEVIDAVSEAIETPPPDGLSWRRRHIQAFMVAKLGFKEVPPQRAAEVLAEAKKINRTKNDD